MKRSGPPFACYLYASNEQDDSDHFESVGSLTRLENGYRKYAKVFESVTLLLDEGHDHAWYHNYPHISLPADDGSEMEVLSAALEDAPTDAVFIGASEIDRFPLSMLVKLVREYNGESFLGFEGLGSHQPWFGIYSKDVLRELKAHNNSIDDLAALDNSRLLPLPEDVDLAEIRTS